MGVKEYCIEIYNLLSRVGESAWANEFEAIINDYDLFEQHHLLRRIKSIYGGAGSFNDLVLYKNGQQCYDENNGLDELRSGLYESLAKRW